MKDSDTQPGRSISAPVPTDPEDIAAAMDPWESANGPTDLYDELVAHLGKSQADELWTRAMHAYDAMHATPQEASR